MLPEGLLMRVFEFLDATSLRAAACVSQYWYKVSIKQRNRRLEQMLVAAKHAANTLRRQHINGVNNTEEERHVQPAITTHQPAVRTALHTGDHLSQSNQDESKGSTAGVVLRVVLLFLCVLWVSWLYS